MFKKPQFFIHKPVSAFVLSKDSQLNSFHKTFHKTLQPVLKYLSFAFWAMALMCPGCLMCLQLHFTSVL